jgi:hypothetical protein
VFIFQNKNLSYQSAFGGQFDFLPSESFTYQTTLRQLSKVADALQPL